MTDDHILEMRAITKEFPGVKALQDVSLSVRRQEIHAICGENGAGKSTLMKVLSGVYPAGSYSGEIHFDGRLCEFSDIRQSEQRGIVIIHQELALSPYLSIAENIFLGNERAKRGFIDWSESVSGRTRSRRSWTSVSASNSWWKSRRRCPRMSSCSSSTSRPPPSTTS